MAISARADVISAGADGVIIGDDVISIRADVVIIGDDVLSIGHDVIHPTGNIMRKHRQA